MNVDATIVARKIRLRLAVPLLGILLLNAIDRVNVSFAALQMNADLGFSPREYGFAVSIFFAGYILFQLPNIWLLEKIGMRRWVCAIALTWGIAATATAFVTSAWPFYVLRFVIGAAEGGYAPGVIWYLSRWMPERYRGSTLALAMLAVPISMVIGGPLSGWLMEVSNPLSWPGWRWMFLVEGLPTVILAVLALWIFVDEPRNASWLSSAEKEWLSGELVREPSANAEHRAPLWTLWLRRDFWITMLCWFSIMTGTFGIIFWLPQIIKNVAPGISDTQTGLLSALPWVAAGVGMMVNSWHSDKTKERRLHVSLPMLLAGVFMGLAAIAGSGVAALLCLVSAGLFLGGSQGTFWTLPPVVLGTAYAASAVAFINICGNSAGVIAPILIGWIREQTGSFQLPVLAMGAVLMVGGLSGALLLPRSKLR